MVKQVRIGRDGKIVDADRTVSTTKDPGKGGPDLVHWITLGGGNYVISFQNSPFRPGAQKIAVPGGAETVTQSIGRYKYDVLDSNGNVLDDPDVIIDS